MSRKRKQKPLFKKRYTSGQIAFRIVVSIIVIAILLFVGISVGKPLVDRFYPDAQQGNNPPDIPDAPDTPDVSNQTEPSESQSTSPTTTEPEPVVTEPPVIKQGVYYFTFPEAGDAAANISLLTDGLKLASQENYYAFCVELISEGGMVNYTTKNELANDADAITDGAVDINQILGLISEYDLVPYARISALSDHVASWRDRSICYLFEDGSTKWLDNKLDNGGKPWISPFRDNAKEYISYFVSEISDAGFVGIVAGELEFPPFRNSDLNYIGANVKSKIRYEALCDFSNLLSDTLGSAKSYSIEVDACEILEGNCEVLFDPSLLNNKTVYVKYDAEHIGNRIERPDGSIISFEGLNEVQRMTQMFRLINTQLADSGLRIIPAVDADLTKEEILLALTEIGYKPDGILVY